MIHLPNISVFGYGSDPEHRGVVLHVADGYMASGSGGGSGGPPKKKAPVKKPIKKPKK